ncbi:MAG: hypothetical protein N2321_00295 [Melioribacteraceae bacterium]|nr:hypothetical protein [Melioribacteraceae bacterium]
MKTKMDDQILIIESNTFALKKLREILSREGYNIMTVTSKEAALNICSKIKIDYIIANPQEFDISKTIEEEQK